MAFDSSQLVLVFSANGYSQYRYDTTDGTTTVDTAGYFNNSDDDQNFAVGDLIDVVGWTTAIRTGTIANYGQHIVNSVSAGAVDLTNITVGVVTDDR